MLATAIALVAYVPTDYNLGCVIISLVGANWGLGGMRRVV